VTDPRPSTLATVVAAAARAGDPSDPAVLAAAARDARIEEASRALRDAHLAVADAAGEWYDADRATPRHTREYADEASETRDDLRAAIEAWRAAGEAFARAVRS
jgi:hypothetical protein